jgi:transposase
LKVKRFFCRNNACSKRTFAEKFPELVAPYARQTERVTKRQQQISLNVCARTSEELLKLDQIGISDTTVNRLIRSFPDPELSPSRVVGVDDWAKRKGQNYGTILVDLERGQVVDLLEDRTADTLAQWLEKHPEIEIVSRDRSQTYAEAINRGAPEAVQIADRWHLFKNLSDAVFKILEQEYAFIKKRLKLDPEKNNKDKKSANTLLQEDETLTPAEQRRKDRILEAQQLHCQGWTQKRIADHLNIHTKTVRRYLQSPSPKTRRSRTGRLLDPYKPYVIQRWNEGCHNASQIFREIQKQGFPGQITIVRDFVRPLRQKDTSVNPDPIQQRLPSLRKLTWFILRRTEQRTKEDEKVLDHISNEKDKLSTTIILARRFATIIRKQQASELDPWLIEAGESSYKVWRNFANSLKRDYDAVHAALMFQWSNGPTEGHINRLKCLKRQMYGRAKDDLLRKRVLWQGRWSFT